jgi:hypothetical protein
LKLFQIEEPDGTPLEADGPGAAVGIALGHGVASVAIAVGGNAELLAQLPIGDPAETLLWLRGQAEKVLARPVTHAVIAADAAVDPAPAGLVLLRLVPAEVGALGAACLAEDLAPRPS